MSTQIDQKTYLLNKYLKPQSGEKKKKKKKHAKGTGLRIIDDDIDTSRLRPLEADEVEALGLNDEDGPQIAGIVDERPEHVKEMEKFKTGYKWRIISQNDGGESKLRVEEIERDSKREREETGIIFGKMYSDSEDEKHDSDQSPPRKQKNNDSNKQKNVNSKKERTIKSDREKTSGKRDNIERNAGKVKHDSDGDLSPPRSRNRKESSDMSPPRNVGKDGSKKNIVLSDSDVSPPRKNVIKSKDRKKSRWGDFPSEEQHMKDTEISRKNRQSKDTDISPPRRSNKSPLMYLKNSDSDNSPPRKRSKSTKIDQSVGSDLSPPRTSKYSKPSGSKRDLSPPRYESDRNRDKRRNASPRRTIDNNSKNKREASVDLSPPRRKKDVQRYESKRERSNDSDLSPPRKRDSNRTERTIDRAQGDINHKRKRDRSVSPRRTQFDSKDRSDYRIDSRSKETGRYDCKRNDDSPPPTNKKMAKTLEGKTAGLQDARSMRDEASILRRREDDFYNKMAPEMSGREATTVNRRLGKRETSEERQQNKEKAERKREMEEKYGKWGKGLKQISDQEKRQQDYIHEASKPLARSRDDADLERALKSVAREGDPMLQYIRSKRPELEPDRPMYKGDWPPNRFNVRPGYRWDGVDRSNGYEKRYFEQKSKSKALEEEAYKWSTEDL